MRKWKSAISAILAGIMILSMAASAFAATVTFTDTSTHWAKDQIQYLVSKDVLNGYKQSNGTYTFQPDGTVTRAEFIKMLDETFGLTATKSISFNDVKSSDWFYPYFAKAAAQGYLLNYGTSCSPNGKLTREEATTLLVRYLGLTGTAEASSSSFTDYYSISENFRSSVMIAVNAGLVNGYKENNGSFTFRPKNTLTRAEALTILYRAAGAIYNTSAYTKDSGSASTNAVITRGGVTLSKLALSGRVIVTEGAAGDPVTLTGCTSADTIYVRGSANLILDNSTIKNIVLLSPNSTVMISLMNGTTVENLTLSTKASLMIGSGTKIANLVVESSASGVGVTGNGAIGKAVIYANNFVSSVMPSEFSIASGLTANFNGTVYSGSSDDQSAFSTVPYISEKDGDYFINMSADYTGRLYYYFTNVNSTPNTDEFDPSYANAKAKNSFYVTKGKSYSEKVGTKLDLGDYSYVVLQLVTDDRTYAPVRISNTPTSGSGFTTDPYLIDTDEIAFTPQYSGTVWYFYTDSADSLTTAKFQEQYKKTDGEFKGTTTVSANRSESIYLKERYLSNYPYIAIMLETSNGLYFQPVLVSAGDNGFDVEPKITTVGTIEFKTNVTGTLYYYYAKTNDQPSPDKFLSNWRSARENGNMDVVRNRTLSMTYKTSLASTYPYIVFCIKDGDNFLTPFVLDISYNSGFSVDPYVSAAEEISFKPNVSGTVDWYFSKTSTAPTSSEFNREWSNTTSARRGSVRASANNFGIINFDDDYTASYPYIVVMLTGSDGKAYQPVVVDVLNNSNSGFSISPYCDTYSEKVYFKTASDGYIAYYFSRSSSTNGLTEDFDDMYNSTSSSYKGSFSVRGGELNDIDFSSVDTSRYGYLVIQFTDKNNKSYLPTYISLTTSTAPSSNGITILAITEDTVKISVVTTGKIYYMPTDKQEGFSKYLATTMYVTADGIYYLPIDKDYRYMAIASEDLIVQYVDVSSTYEGGSGDDGSNTRGSGFKSYSRYLDNDSLTLTVTFVPEVSGTVSFFASNSFGSTTKSVVAGTEYTESFDISPYLDFDNVTISRGVAIYMQLTSGEKVYERVVVFES